MIVFVKVFHVGFALPVDQPAVEGVLDQVHHARPPVRRVIVEKVFDVPRRGTTGKHPIANILDAECRRRSKAETRRNQLVNVHQKILAKNVLERVEMVVRIPVFLLLLNHFDQMNVDDRIRSRILRGRSVTQMPLAVSFMRLEREIERNIRANLHIL